MMPATIEIILDPSTAVTVEGLEAGRASLRVDQSGAITLMISGGAAGRIPDLWALSAFLDTARAAVATAMATHLY